MFLTASSKSNTGDNKAGSLKTYQAGFSVKISLKTKENKILCKWQKIRSTNSMKDKKKQNIDLYQSWCKLLSRESMLMLTVFLQCTS